MPRRCSLTLFLAVAWLLSTPGGNADPAPPEPGLAIGTPAPAFTLVDQTGQRRSLETLLERGKLAIVFYRSADW